MSNVGRPHPPGGRLAPRAESAIDALLVEDSPADAELVAAMLRHAEPERAVLLTTVGTAREAEHVLESRNFDVVLLDLVLPDASGVEALDRIQASSHRVPIVVLTGVDDAGTIETSLGRGARDYLVKDMVDPDRLLRTIRYAADRKHFLDSLVETEERWRGAEVALLRVTEELQTMVEELPVIVMRLDSLGRVSVAAGRGLQRAGIDPAALRGRNVRELYADAPPLVEAFERVLAGEQLRLSATRGERTWDLHFEPVATPGGEQGGALVVAVDITEQAEAERALKQSEERFRSLVQNVSDMVSVHDADGTVLYVSPSVGRMLGFDEPDRLIGTHLGRFVHPDDVEGVRAAILRETVPYGSPIRFRARDASRNWRHVESTANNLLAHPAIRGIVVTTRDVTTRVAFEEELRAQTRKDALTGLPNRLALVDHLDARLTTDTRLTVLRLDIDRFRFVNDSFGYAAGDYVIRSAARLLQEASSGYAARVGGDEFVVVVEGPDSGDAERVGRRLQSALESVLVNDRPIYLTVSVGAALSHQGIDAEQLLHRADAAVDHAKRQGRGEVMVYGEALETKAERRLSLETALSRAVDDQAFTVLYQPQVDLSVGSVIGAEALVRWADPERGMVPPGEFIDIAEDTNLIVPIGAFVLDSAVATAHRWQDLDPAKRTSIAVNLSARQLADPGLLSMLEQTLDRHGLEPPRLCLEITESVLMDDAAASVDRLRRIKALGVRIAIDDFGTGYSSLAYLKRFPVDYIKVDRSFVDGLPRDAEDVVLVRTIIDLAANLGCGVIAEGVETEEQLEALRELGCTLAQGYLWSRPIPVDEATEFFGRTLPVGDATAAPRLPRPDPTDAIRAMTEDMRTPLTVIAGYAETLATAPREAAMKLVASAGEAISRSVSRVTSLFRLLDDAETIETGALRLERAPTKLDEIVEETAEWARATVRREVTVTGSIDDLAAVRVDRRRVSQVLEHLLTNAAKYSPARTAISIEIRTEDREVQIAVIDEGPGIPPEHVATVFEKFSRLDLAQPGSGLGLFVARGLARAHGGELSYRRAVTGGSEFVLSLPTE